MSRVPITRSSSLVSPALRRRCISPGTARPKKSCFSGVPPLQGYSLQTTNGLDTAGPAAYSTVPTTVVIVGGQYTATNAVAPPGQFFRLKK
jgi:hypothetical protein